MAESKLSTSIKQDFLSCALCLELFRDPVAMNCLHTFCTECLSTYAEKNQIKPGLNLKCPVCRAPMTLPADGVEGLCKNHWIKNLAELVKETSAGPGLCMCKDEETSVIHCMDCGCGLCVKCQESHQRMPIFEKHHLVSYEELKEGKFNEEYKAIRPLCDQHKMPKDIYCKQETCKSTICLKCTVLHHNGHQAVTVEEQVKENITTLQELAKNMKETKTKLGSEIQEGKSEQEQITSTDEEVIKIIKEKEKYMISCIEKEANRLISEIRQISQKDKEKVSSQITSVKEQLQDIQSAIQIIENLLQNSSHESIMCTTPALGDKCKKLREKAGVKLVWKRETKLAFVPGKITNEMISAQGAMGTVRQYPDQPFQVGDTVKVRPEIKQPHNGWGRISHQSTGTITSIDGDKLNIRFIIYSGRFAYVLDWTGLRHEMEFV